jgi:outer membrane protein assembly factor BamB
MKTLFALLALASLQAQEWPQFRGPNASGLSPSEKAPLHWNGETGKGIAWKTEIPGLGISSPVIAGNRIYVTSAISSNPNAKLKHGLYGSTESDTDTSKHAWKLFALDRATGKILWERTAHEGAPKTKRHPKSTQASCTPATDGKYVAAWFASEGLYVYDTAGKLVWKKDLGPVNAGWFFEPDYEWGAASSPVIYQGKLILQLDRQADSFLAAFNLADGKELWRTPRPEIPSWGTPTVVETKDGPIIVANGTKGIRGYSLATGKELWHIGPNSEITVATPITAGGLIYVANSYPPNSKTLAIKPGFSGDLSQTPDALAWSNNRGVYIPTPIIHDGRLYIVQNNGILHVYDAASGATAYQARIGQGGAHSASPVAAAGKLYFPSEDGEIFVVKPGPAYELLATNPMGEVLMATPALAGNTLYVRGLKHLFAIPAAD